MVQGTKTPEGVIYKVETGPPINTSIDDPDNQRFKEDDFRMLYMKVLPCSIRHVHDWSSCNFTHPGEKARRRDPQTYSYTGIACPDMKKTGLCVRGDRCPYAHNVFEYWLHPTRYRSQLCNDGPKCKRKVCFFAHTIDELRVPPSKPFVAPDMLVGSPETEGPESQAPQMEVGMAVPSPVKPGHPGQVEQPYIHSPVAVHEPPPVRNMSMSTASTSGSVELPTKARAHEPHASQSAGTFMSSQNVSFAPPEGFMDVDTTAAKGRTSPISEPATSPSATSALQEVAANLASVKSAIRSGVADRNQVIDMLTNLLRETLQETTAASSREVSPTPGIGRTANAFANPIASAPSSSQNDPFSTAAESSFDAPWPKKNAVQEPASGMSSAAASATLTAVPAMSYELSLDALLIANSGRPGSSSARGPTTSQPLLLGSSHPLPGEGLLNTTTRQSSAPDTPNLSARAAASSSHASRAQLGRPHAEVATTKPPSGLSSSQGQQQQAAALQQQLLQQLQMRRAAQYGAREGKSPANRAQTFPDLHTALEEYSRTGDMSVLQGMSNFMGSSDQNLRSLSADVRQSPGFAASAGQGTGLTARDLLFPDSFSDPYQFGMDPSQGQSLGATYLSAVEMNAPRAGSAPAFLNTAAANSVGGYGGYVAGLGPNMYGRPYGSAFNTEGAGGPAQVTDEQTGGSSLSAFEAGYLHAATAMGIRRGEGTLPATSYAGPPRSGPENWSQQR